MSGSGAVSGSGSVIESHRLVRNYNFWEPRPVARLTAQGVAGVVLKLQVSLLLLPRLTALFYSVS